MRSIRCLAFVALALSTLAPAQLNESVKDVDLTARIIGALPQIVQLKSLSDPLQVLSTRQEISEKVLAASLQVDAATAQIDNEITQANEVRGLLANTRDRTVNRANLLSVVIGGAIGAASSGLQLPSGLGKPSSVVGMAGGVASSGLGVAGIRAQKGATRIFDFNSNMLAKLFEKPSLPDSDYPPIVWSFLSQVAPTDPDQITRKERLIKTWVAVLRIDSPLSPAGRNKIDRVTSQPAGKIQLTIDDLEDRSAMLEDVRAKLSFLKRDLAALLLSLPHSEN